MQNPSTINKIIKALTGSNFSRNVSGTIVDIEIKQIQTGAVLKRTIDVVMDVKTNPQFVKYMHTIQSVAVTTVSPKISARF